MLLAARDAFAARGYSGASMRTIAADAGVTAMALYNYASSKAALFELVWGESVEALYAEFAKAIAGQATLVDEINAVFDAAYAAFVDDPVGLLFTSRLLVERRHPDLAHIDLHLTPYAEFFVDITERAVRRRELKRSQQVAFIGFVTTLLWGFTSIATLEPAVLQISVEASKAAVARFLR
ncbi:MAG TPA: TetR/AcrR family transcriptional regulator [Acidimicrobiales bacterium]|nr:TetR/AcrR family transcriptional regulator [Acidimicrobiales bacterium]